MEMLLYGQLMIIACVSGQSLSSSDSVMKRPGESVTLSCGVSGFSMSSHWMHWIRQKPGRGLEWVGYIDTGSSAYYAQSLQGQFSITKDTSKNMLYLEVKSLKTEDTAVYYCARYWYRLSFDYWGSGTKVTVTNTQPSAPKSIFALSQCSAGSDELLVGCVARGFSPVDYLTFKWKDSAKDLDTFVQYPAFGSDGDYTKISHIRVKKSDWTPQNPYICEASNSKGSVKATVTPPAPPPDQPATVVLTVPTKNELENGTATFLCLARQFSPKAYSFKWFQDGQVVSEAIDTYDTSEKNGSITLYSATSIFKISADTWTDKDTKVKCEFEHKAGNVVREAQYAGSVKPCVDPPKPSPPKFTLTLRPPVERELFVNNKVVLEAVVSGDVRKTVEEASVSCTVKNAPVSENIKAGNVYTDTSLFKRVHNVTVDRKKWFDGEMVTCTIRDTNINQNINFDKGDGQKPNVAIYRPDLINNTVSLVCEVTSQKLGNVYIMWIVGREPYIEAVTSAPIHQKNSKSVLSILTVSKQEYEDPQTTITCAVKHANMKNTTSPLQVTTSKSKQTECPIY